MTPEQIAHKVAGDWVMGPIDMGDLERRIADAIRVEHARLDVAYVALQRIQIIAEQAHGDELGRITQINMIIQQARRALVTLHGER